MKKPEWHLNNVSGCTGLNCKEVRQTPQGCSADNPLKFRQAGRRESGKKRILWNAGALVMPSDNSVLRLPQRKLLVRDDRNWEDAHGKGDAGGCMLRRKNPVYLRQKFGSEGPVRSQGVGYRAAQKPLRKLQSSIERRGPSTHPVTMSCKRGSLPTSDGCGFTTPTNRPFSCSRLR
jgi:hypothetical protein